MRRIAVFDFDGTLSRRDVLVEFMIRFAGISTFLRAVLGHWRVGVGVVLGRASRDQLKAALFEDVFAGRAASDVDLRGIEFADLILRKRLRTDMRERLMWHHRSGHETVIVSASLEAYLRPLARALGIDHVIAVRLASDASGILTGKMVGANVRGPRKATLLAAWLGTDEAEIWAYGDSSGDSELLAMADHPVWVGRGARSRPTSP